MNTKKIGLFTATILIALSSILFLSGTHTGEVWMGKLRIGVEKREVGIPSNTRSSSNTPHPAQKEETPVAHATTSPKRIYNSTNTDIVVQKYDIHGTSMEPTIKNGETVEVNMNYYNNHQHKVLAGDVVVFENPFSLKRIIKRVYIVPGDTVEKDEKNRTLLVNGKVVKNPIGVVYTFDDRAYRWIDIYTKSGAIIDNTYFIFGDNVNNSLDSRKTGPVTLEGILGKKVE